MITYRGLVDPSTGAMSEIMYRGSTDAISSIEVVASTPIAEAAKSIEEVGEQMEGVELANDTKEMHLDEQVVEPATEDVFGMRVVAPTPGAAPEPDNLPWNSADSNGTVQRLTQMLAATKKVLRKRS